MWLLRRLKIVKLDPHIILEYYLKEVRPLLEQGVPIWKCWAYQSTIQGYRKCPECRI